MVFLCVLIVAIDFRIEARGWRGYLRDERLVRQKKPEGMCSRSLVG